MEVLDEAGSLAAVVRAGQPCTFRLRYRAQVALDDLTFGLGFVHESRAVVSSPTSARTGPCSVASGDGYVDFRVPELFLQAGSYEISTTIADRGHVYDHTANELVLRVRGQRDDEPGLTWMPGEWLLPVVTAGSSGQG